jgi:hypothetical protein
MRALETRGSPIRELLQLVSFNLAEEEYGLRSLPRPYVRRGARPAPQFAERLSR